MDPELLRAWRRWTAAERDSAGDAVDADEAFRAVFAAVPVRQPREGFADAVVMATARLTARRARVVKVALTTAAVVAAALSLVALWELPRLLGAAFNLVVGAIVSTTLALGRGLDAWTVLAQIVRALGSVVVTPQGTYGLIALAVIAVGALYALQRMLEVEERSSL
jgi:hypothetical protein